MYVYIYIHLYFCIYIVTVLIVIGKRPLRLKKIKPPRRRVGGQAV
jgi:hypothetical protein